MISEDGMKQTEGRGEVAGVDSPAAIERRYWDAHASDYAPVTESSYASLLAHLPKFERGTLLSIGCGAGAFERRIAAQRPELQIFGIDIAPKFVAFNPFSSAAGNAMCLPVRDRSCDAVLFPAALHHMHPWEQACREADRVLKPGGWLLMHETNCFHPWRFLTLNTPLRPLLLETTDQALNCFRILALFEALGYADADIRFLSLPSPKPNLSGIIQRWVDSLPRPNWMERYLHPWFVLRIKKSGA